jgi:hypothetical protein
VAHWIEEHLDNVEMQNGNDDDDDDDRSSCTGSSARGMPVRQK